MNFPHQVSFEGGGPINTVDLVVSLFDEELTDQDLEPQNIKVTARILGELMIAASKERV